MKIPGVLLVTWFLRCWRRIGHLSTHRTWNVYSRSHLAHFNILSSSKWIAPTWLYSLYLCSIRNWLTGELSSWEGVITNGSLLLSCNVKLPQFKAQWTQTFMVAPHHDAFFIPWFVLWYAYFLECINDVSNLLWHWMWISNVDKLLSSTRLENRERERERPSSFRVHLKCVFMDIQHKSCILSQQGIHFLSGTSPEKKPSNWNDSLNSYLYCQLTFL